MFSVSILFFGRLFRDIYGQYVAFLWREPGHFIIRCARKYKLTIIKPAQGCCGLAVHKICVKPLFRNLRRVITEYNGKSRLNLLLHFPQTRYATRLSRLLIAASTQRWYICFETHS